MHTSSASKPPLQVCARARDYLLHVISGSHLPGVLQPQGATSVRERTMRPDELLAKLERVQKSQLQATWTLGIRGRDCANNGTGPVVLIPGVIEMV